MNPAQLLAHFDCIGEAPDAITRLRRFILDLAVRGKLVEQDPRDEPASELLKRIQGEKMRLVKEGKIKELKPLAITGTAKEICGIPSSWKLVALGETVNSHLGGGTPSKNNSIYWDGDIRWASVKDVGKGKYIDETIDRITELGLADSSSNLVPPGRLIVVTRMGLGKVSINRVPIAINQDLRALSLSSLVSIDYHYIFFKTHGFEGTGLTVKGIKVEELLNIAFPLPPLAEQHRIVAKVDEMMGLCDRLETAQTERESRRDRLVASSLHHLNYGADPEVFREHARFYFNHLPRLTIRPDHIKQLRQTILNLAVRGKLVPQDPTDEPASELLKRIQQVKTQLVEAKILRPSTSATNSIDRRNEIPIPPTWSWAKCEEVLFVTKLAGFEYTKHFNLTREGETPVIRAQNVRPGKIDKTNVLYIDQKTSEILSRSALTKPCMLMTFIGAGIGDVALFDEKSRWHLAPNVAKIEEFPGCIDQLDLSYLILLMNSPFGRKEIFKHIKATAQPSISMGTIRDIDMPLPPRAEQHRIVAKVDELMALCDQLETQLTTTQSESRRLLEAVLHPAPHYKFWLAGMERSCDLS